MLPLRRHPDSAVPPQDTPPPDNPVATLEAAATRRPDGGLDVRFVLCGDISALAIPPRAAPARRDDLWRRTCFEVFLRATDGADYLEFNLSPSGEWAAYAFSGYRERATDPDVAAPALAVEVRADRLALTARLDVPGLPADRPWRAGLTAVIETADGRHGYWAVAHPAGRPDFHHADGFVVDLPPPQPEAT